MKLTRAEMEIDGRAALYGDMESIADEHAAAPFIGGAVLVLSVKDYAEAEELAATIERSRAHKRALKSTPAVQPEAGSPPASVGLPGRSTEEQLYKGDVPECLAFDCHAPGEMSDMCAAHYVSGISDKAKAGLRAKKNARQAPLPEKQNGAKHE